VLGPEVAVPSGKVEGTTAFCPAGTRAISGGGYAGIAKIGVSEAETNRAGWFVITNNDTTITTHLQAEVLCAPAGSAVAASHRGPTMRQALAQVRAEVAASHHR
jgi:GT2 family glycosyltransferase